MKFLITGIAGFIGSQLAEICLNKNCEVIGIDKEASDLWRIKELAKDISLITVDLEKKEALKNALAEHRIDICIHCAWFTIPGRYLTSGQNVNSLMTTLDLVSLLADRRCKTFIGVGTCFEYDSSYGYLSEDTPTASSTIYSTTKTAAQNILQHLGNIYGMRTAWARLFYLYGPKENPNRLVPAVIRSLLMGEAVKTTPGEQIRDFLHVYDVASALYEIAVSEISGVINIGSGQPISVRNIIEEIARQIGRPELPEYGALNYREGDPMFICANNSILRKKTNWHQKYDLNEGLSHTIQWWKMHLIKISDQAD